MKNGCANRKQSNSGLSRDGDALDTQGDSATRYLDFHLVAHFLTKQDMGNGGPDRNLARTQVSLVLAQDGIGHLCLGGKIGHLHL